MAFILGDKSLRELIGVHPTLSEVAELAIQYTTQDFTVYDGLRTDAEQQLLLRRGATKTLDSYHKKQRDGFGHAMDLVPIIGGVPVWDWDGCYKIAAAVDRAATELNVAHLITWGAVWDKNLTQLDLSTPAMAKRAVQDYGVRHAGADFLDGPHWQLKR